MPPKDIKEAKVYIQTENGYQEIESLEPVELTPETEQDRLNQMAVDALRSILPDNMKLIMNNGR